jgi:hypothetical protein
MRTVLIVLAALLIAGCGGAGSAGDSYKPKESDAGTNTAREERGTNTPATAADTAIGETADRGDFEFRVLDVVRDESWRYPDPDDPFRSSAQSYAGEFAVVWYAVRNTGDVPLNLGKLGDTSAGLLAADTGESFGVSEDAACAPTQPGGIKNLQPRGLQLSCLIFDMPADATPESVEVRFGNGYQPARVDLTTQQPESIEPDETLALQYEFSNAGYFDLAYGLFAPSSQQQFTYAQYEANVRPDWPRGVYSGYAFPSVTVEGDHATVERVLTIYDTKTSYKGTARRTQELVRVGGAWRIVARPEQVSSFTS